MHKDRFLVYKWGLILLVSLGLVLFLQTPVVLAHEINVADHVHDDELFQFEEVEGALKLRVDVSDSQLQIALDESGKAIWHYVGPSNSQQLEVNCSSFNWVSLQTQVQVIEARVRGEVASITLNLPPSITDDFSYCFRVGLAAEADETDVQYYYRLYLLKDVAGVSNDVFIFEVAAPLTDTTVPSQVAVSPISGYSVDQTSWQYVAITNGSDCNESLTVGFSDLTTADNLNSQLSLTLEDAGKIYCFRALDSTGSEQYLYDYYEIPNWDIDPTTVVNNQESNLLRTWLIVAGIVICAGIIIIVMVRSKN